MKGSNDIPDLPGGDPVPAPDSRRPPADSPIPLWPDGVIAAAAGAVLLAVAYRHRRFLGRRVREAERAIREFQRRGGLDEVRNLCRQLGELARSDE